jgi:hypothetical protein
MGDAHVAEPARTLILVFVVRLLDLFLLVLLHKPFRSFSCTKKCIKIASDDETSFVESVHFVFCCAIYDTTEGSWKKGRMTRIMPMPSLLLHEENIRTGPPNAVSRYLNCVS